MPSSSRGRGPAEWTAPVNAPAPKHAERSPSVLGPASSVSEVSTGEAWRLKPAVLTTIVIASTRAAPRASAGRRRAPSARFSAPWMLLGRSRITGSLTRMSQRLVSTARKLSALIAKRAPTPNAATRTPANAGPITRDPLKRLALSAIALGSSCRPTIWNVSAWRPGASKTSAVPAAARARTRARRSPRRRTPAPSARGGAIDAVCAAMTTPVVELITDDAADRGRRRRTARIGKERRKPTGRPVCRFDDVPGQGDVPSRFRRGR